MIPIILDAGLNATSQGSIRFKSRPGAIFIISSANMEALFLRDCTPSALSIGLMYWQGTLHLSFHVFIFLSAPVLLGEGKYLPHDFRRFS